MANIQNLKPTVRLAIHNPGAKGDSEFGRGVANLCQGVRDKGSLNAAAKSMGMAYSKAWRIVKSTEETLGVPLLNRDGAHGSTLTDEGSRLLDAYFEVNEKLQQVAEQLYEEHFAQ